MHLARRPLISDFNQHLVCILCKGYFIDATTITECLHSFCRSCIVKFLENNKYCPVCDILVHKTKPLLNLRPDRTLQDIVYKLVPKLFQNEVQRRRTFHQTYPEAKISVDQIEENYQHIISLDETISIRLCYYGCIETTRYLRCPAAVSVGHLHKLIRAKYGLFDNHYVDILYNQDCLTSSLTLLDVAYIYSWKRKAPIELSYRIYEYATKKLKLEDERKKEESDVLQTNNIFSNNNNNWKEVQLRISENGEMSIIQNEPLEIVNNNNYKPSEILTVVDSKVTKKELPELKYIGKSATLTEQNSVTSVSLSSTTTKTVFSTINSSKCSVSSDNNDTKKYYNKKEQKTEKASKPTAANETKGVKRKLDTPSNEQPIKQTILNHSINLHNLSNNHPLKKHSQLPKVEEKVDEKIQEKTDDVIFSKPKPLTNTNLSRPGTPKPTTTPCYMPKPVINIPRPPQSINTATKTDKVQVSSSTSITTSKSELKQTTANNQNNQRLPSPPPTTTNRLIKNKASTPIGYKTLRDPPKSWNSQIAKANLNKPISDPKYSDLKNVRPAKFFKMRNNIPRYLGNPASGVKPMYQVHQVSPEKDKEKSSESSLTNKVEIKKHSIVKIDPKTLKPITEKAPETTSLSNSTTSDLKINTSSVSIFNPLKLQNSPKTGERKSPKSPHSPKIGKNSPPNKRDKLNLNFTPSNPFIPNLTSPTVSPNQFLFPTAPPGFPPYDPRFMAAYHNLLYGQRMGFPAGLSLDLNQRKNFDLSGPTSPKVGGMAQPHSPQQPAMKVSNSDSISHSLSTSPRTSMSSSTSTTNSSHFKPQSHSPLRKSGKDSTNKNEKSLQNAVEKLTQNRVREIKSDSAISRNTTITVPKPEDPAPPIPTSIAIQKPKASQLPPVTSSHLPPSSSLPTIAKPLENNKKDIESPSIKEDISTTKNGETELAKTKSDLKMKTYAATAVSDENSEKNCNTTK